MVYKCIYNYLPQMTNNKSTLDIAKVKSAAQDGHNETPNQSMWPDCWSVSQQIIDHLFATFDISLSDLLLVECYPTDGYEHYIVEIRQPEKNILIDGSYYQFSYEADTPVSIDSIDNMDSVAIFQPSGDYPFFDKIRNKEPATNY